MAIGVLGPLTVGGGVGGDTVSLGRRDRVVLEVLALSPGEVVPAERLADAMWGDVVPPTWNKVIQGCVVRLRKALGASAIETGSSGYRMTVVADEIDACRFERLVRRSRELLTLGETDRAAYVSGEALALWRGPPFEELEGWDAGRIEARRLEVLRLDAEEIRIEAALRAGRYREILGEAQASVAGEPLRERRWALLALAQYQAGRQGDALRTLHQARGVLVEEVGVDPGPDLVNLEQAILRQDPSLIGAEALAVPAPECPYVGLLPYDVVDADSFFGRDDEVAAGLARIVSAGVLAVVGPSGSGKSSLVRAGIAASLLRSGHRAVVITPGPRPLDGLEDLLPSDTAAVLVVDQLEEVFTACEDPAERASFLAALADASRARALVVALRADHLGELTGHPAFAGVVEPGLHLLRAMSESDLRATIEGPARQAGLLLEPGLVDLLVREVEGEPGALPLLSHALHETWQRREGRTLTVEGYQQTGGIRGAVAQSAEDVYARVPEDQRPYLRDLLLRLVTPSPEGEPVRSRVPRRIVASDAQHERLIEMLVAARLVTSDDGVVELAHEALVRAWPRLQTWLDDDVEGQRTMRHLAVTADAWDGMERPESELYRGVRLANALEWRARARPDLTPIETEFLDESQMLAEAEEQSAERRAREQTRANRRLRAALAGLAALLVVALLAGLLALRQARRADREAAAADREAAAAEQAALAADREAAAAAEQAAAADRAAVVADARRLGAQALVAEDVDRSLLLATEGLRLDDSADTRANLLATLSRSPELIGSVRGDGSGFISLALSPDGDVATVGRSFAGLSFYDTRTRAMLQTFDDVPVWKFAYRPDGRQLAISTQPPRESTTATLPTPAVRLLDAVTLAQDDVALGDLPKDAFPHEPQYSADGRLLAVPFDELAMVWDLTSPDAAVLRVEAPGTVPSIALSPDGGMLYVGTTDPPAITVYDVPTARPLRVVDVPGGLVRVSPDGRLLAVATANDIVLLDAATLTEMGRLRGHTDGVIEARFSHDGTLLASGSADESVILWDVATGERRAQLTGHAGAVWGVAFSPDDSTLYTTGLDDSLLSWDLRGDRRSVPRQLLVEPVTDANFSVEGSPTGAAVAYFSLAAGDVGQDPTALVRFLDVGDGRAAPAIDTGHVTYGAYSWRPDGEQLATAGADGFVRLWDWQIGQVVRERQVAPGHIAGLDYTGDGKHLVVAERDGRLSAIDAETLEPAGTPVDIDDDLVWAFAGPDLTTSMATGVLSFTLVDLRSGRVIEEGDIGFNPQIGDFTADGRRFAITGVNGEVRVLDVRRGEWVGPARVGHDGPAGQAAFAPDGATFVTSGADGSVGLWDGATGAPLGAVVPGRPDVYVQARFLPDGHTVLMSSMDGTVSTWDTRPDRWAEHACAIAGRNLTLEEWRDVLPARPYGATCPEHASDG